MGAEEIASVRAKVEETRVSLARVEGRLETIGVQIDANAEQRERMERTLNEILKEARHTNGRLRTAEGNIANLKHGQSNLAEDLARSLVGPDGQLRAAIAAQLVGPDGALRSSDGTFTVPVVAQRPPLTSAQKVGVGAGISAVIAASIPNLIELLKQAIDLIRHSGAAQ